LRLRPTLPKTCQNHLEAPIRRIPQRFGHESHSAEPEQERIPVPNPVCDLIRLRAVKLPAVGFDDQPPVDQRVDIADERDLDLRLNLKPGADQHHSDVRFVAGCRTPVRKGRHLPMSGWHGLTDFAKLTRGDLGSVERAVH
jgi:hypothetical protein